MEVRPGYKQTDVGIFPEGWNLTQVGEVAMKVGSGVTPTGGQRVYKSEGRPFMRSQNVGWGALLLDDVAFIDDATHYLFAATEIKADDVFLNITGASIGRTAVADRRVEGGNVNQHVCLIRSDTQRLVPQFLNYLLLSSLGQRQIASFQAGGNRQGLNFAQVRSIQIPLPSITEQEVIARALSDVDALLGALDRLIAKKRDLKQAALQQLLTGQTRLPGFQGKWEVKLLGSLLRFQVGFPFSSVFFNKRGEGIRLVKNRDLKSDDQVFHYNGKYEAAFVIRDGDVLVGMDGDFLPFRWNKGTALLNQRVGRILPNVGLDVGYACYALIKPLKEIQTVTSGTTVKHLSHGDVEGIVIPFPELSEQTAIASVLADMDAELAVLEQRREKTRAIKQGMMQELLTGKTRLI